MKKKLLYQSPTAEEFLVKMESSMLTTSDVDFGSGIDDAIEDTWIITELPSIF